MLSPWRVCFGRGRARRARSFCRNLTDKDNGRDAAGNFGNLEKKDIALAFPADDAGVGLPPNNGQLQDEDLRRDLLILSATPACFTVVSLDDGQALRQNLTSRRWMGDRVRKHTGVRPPHSLDKQAYTEIRASGSQRGTLKAPRGAHEATARARCGDLLTLIFMHEPDALAEVLKNLVFDGDVWKGVVRVPTSAELSFEPHADDDGAVLLLRGNAAVGATCSPVQEQPAAVTAPPPLRSLSSTTNYHFPDQMASLLTTQQDCHQQQPQPPVRRLRQLFQRVSRISSATRELPTLQNMTMMGARMDAQGPGSWSGGAAASPAPTVPDPNGDAVPSSGTGGVASGGGGARSGSIGGIIAGFFTRGSVRSPAARGHGARTSPAHQPPNLQRSAGPMGSSFDRRVSSPHNTSSAIVARGGGGDGGGGGGNGRPLRDSKVMGLTETMMSILFEVEEGSGSQSELPVTPLRAPSIGRRAVLNSGGVPVVQRNTEQLHGSSGNSLVAGEMHSVGGKTAAGGEATDTEARLPCAERGSQPQSFQIPSGSGGGGGGMTALPARSESFVRTATFGAKRFVLSATSPNFSSPVTSGVNAGAAAAAAASTLPAQSLSSLTAPRLRDANPLSTSTLALSLVRRTCTSNALPGSDVETLSNTEIGSDAYRPRPGRVRRGRSWYSSRPGGEGQLVDEDEGTALSPPRLLRNLGMGESVQSVNASARLLTFAAHLKCAPVATQMLAGVAQVPATSIAAVAGADQSLAPAEGTSGGGHHVPGGHMARTASMPCMEAATARASGGVGAATRGGSLVSTAVASPIPFASAIRSASSLWPRNGSRGRFLMQSMPFEGEVTHGSACSPSSSCGGCGEPGVGDVTSGGEQHIDAVHSDVRPEDSGGLFLLLPGSGAGRSLGTCSSGEQAQPCSSNINTLHLEPWYRPAGQSDLTGQRGFGSSAMPHCSTQDLNSTPFFSSSGSGAAVAANTAAAAAATPSATSASAANGSVGGQSSCSVKHHNSQKQHQPQPPPGSQPQQSNVSNQLEANDPTLSTTALQPAPTPRTPTSAFTQQQPIQQPRQEQQQPAAAAPLLSTWDTHPQLPLPPQLRLQATVSDRPTQFASRESMRSPRSRVLGAATSSAGGAGGVAWGADVQGGGSNGGHGDCGGSSSSPGGGIGRRYNKQPQAAKAISKGSIVSMAEVNAAANAAAAAAAAAGIQRCGSGRVAFMEPPPGSVADDGETSAAATGGLGVSPLCVAAREAAVPLAAARGPRASMAPPLPPTIAAAIADGRGRSKDGPDPSFRANGSSGGGPRRQRMADGVIGMLRQALSSQDRDGAAMTSSHASSDECWHEIWATRASDPVTGRPVVVLVQHDVTAKVVAERHLAMVMETEHRLLEQLFPRHILAYITEDFISKVAASAASSSAVYATVDAQWRPTVRDCKALATWHPQVTLLFADIKGFTPMCKEVEPPAVMAMLNDLYSRYDKMLDEYGVFKVETIGDCYFVAGGLIQEDEDGMTTVRSGKQTDPLHAQKVFDFARAMLAAARQVRMPTSGEPVQIRIGIHSGPVVSGVVGTRMPRFCLFGDTVNTASRMESTGKPGAIHASEETYQLLSGMAAWNPTGSIHVKGKGLLQTYLHVPGDGGISRSGVC